MAGFYSARGWTIPPLPWPNFAPPLSQSAVIEKPGVAADKVKEARSKRDAALKTLAKRNVEVYGAINVRTDGKDMAIAFLKERAVTQRWQIYWYKHNETHDFVPED